MQINTNTIYLHDALPILTKWPEARAMKEATAKNVVEFIYKEIICRHGCPRVILSDRGTHFRNEIVDGLCKKFEIKDRKSTRLNSSHTVISYAVFCLKKKK